MVVVDTVTTISAVISTRLYVKHIWKHHGLPRKMLSDQGPQFVVEFMRELYHLLRIKLAATSQPGVKTVPLHLHQPATRQLG